MLKICSFLLIAFSLCVAALADPVVDWTLRYDPYSKIDQLAAMVMDTSGNIYATGRVQTGSTDFDVRIIKVSPTGTVLWNRTQSTTGDDIPYAIDISSNMIYVAYSSKPVGLNTNVDIHIVKYDVDGVGQWIRRYNGPGNSSDVPTALATDHEGNVYFCGKTYSNSSGWDGVLGKFSAAGALLWAQTSKVDGSSGEDAFLDVSISYVPRALNDRTAVYVAGYHTFPAPYGADATWSAFSYEGVELRRQRIQGTDTVNERLTQAVASRTGEFTVIGSSTGLANVNLNAYNERIGFKPNFLSIWLDEHNGPGNATDQGGAVAYDDFDATYYTGTSYKDANDGSGFITQKRTVTGALAWSRRTDLPGVNSNSAKDIAVDAVYNSYVFGSSFTGAFSQNDWLIVKLDAAGVPVWNGTYAGVIGNDIPVDIEIGRDGDIIVAGTSRGGSNDDIVIRKYHQDPIARNDSYAVGADTENVISFLEGPLVNDTYATQASIEIGLSTIHGTVQVLGDTFAYTPSTGYVGPDSFTYRAKRGSIVSNYATVSLKVGPMPVRSFSILPHSVVGGESATGTITALGTAPTPGVDFPVTDNSSAITVPATVHLPQGQQEVSFPIATAPVSATATRLVTVGLPDTPPKSYPLTLQPGGLSLVTIVDPYIVGGQPATATVALSGPTVTGLDVDLTVNSGSLSVPSFVEFLAGQSSKQVTVNSSPVSIQATRTLTAQWKGVTRTASITLNPADMLSKVTFSPPSVKGGTASTGTVELAKPAPAGGLTVLLTETSAAISGVPASVAVPAGATSATFPVATVPVAANTNATVFANAGAKVSGVLTVTP